MSTSVGAARNVYNNNDAESSYLSTSPYTTRCEGVYIASGNATANAALDFKVSDSQNVESYCNKLKPLHQQAQVGVLCAIF